MFLLHKPPADKFGWRDAFGKCSLARHSSRVPFLIHHIVSGVVVGADISVCPYYDKS